MAKRKRRKRFSTIIREMTPILVKELCKAAKKYRSCGPECFLVGKKSCRTCGIKVGRERFDNGLSCGIHCDECFDHMVAEARSKSW